MNYRSPDVPTWPRADAAAVLIAVLAGVHGIVIASLPINDDFMHLTYSRQLLAGEWPVRDFFDYGMGLMYGVSALGQLLVGDRLLAEAAIVGVMTALSAWLVYTLVRRATESAPASLASALLVLVATPRSYAYPKVIIYAVAAFLWWRYVWEPGRARAIALGLWTGVAFFGRHDHGVYVAAGVMLALVAAHGVNRALATRCLLVGSVAAGLVAPFLVYASVQTGGVIPFIRTELAAAVGEHDRAHPGPRWPLRRAADILRVENAETYAPAIGIRWTSDSSMATRRAVIDRYGLTPTSAEDAQSQRVRLSEGSLLRLRALLSEPAVEDTAGIDRSRAAIEFSAWPVWERARFKYWWLRAHLLPAIDRPAQAGEAATILLYGVSLIALFGVVPWLRPYLPDRVAGARLAAFALFAVVVNVGLLRTPYDVRAADGVVLPAVLLGITVAMTLRMWTRGPRWFGWLAAAAGIAVVVLALKSMAVAGQFFERIDWVAGDWRSMSRARGAWGDVRDRLWTSPPIDYWRGRGAPLSIELARYARDCVPSSDRILVLWFAPEIHYYSDRLMGGRHLYFLPAFGALEHEQRRELDKVIRTAPPIVFANPSFDGSTREAFPGLIEYIGREYEPAGFLDDDDERYRILVRPDRAAVRRYGARGWPCYR